MIDCFDWNIIMDKNYFNHNAFMQIFTLLLKIIIMVIKSLKKSEKENSLSY